MKYYHFFITIINNFVGHLELLTLVTSEYWTTKKLEVNLAFQKNSLKTKTYKLLLKDYFFPPIFYNYFFLLDLTFIEIMSVTIQTNICKRN